MRKATAWISRNTGAGIWLTTSPNGIGSLLHLDLRRAAARVVAHAFDNDPRQDGGHASHRHEVSQVQRRSVVRGMAAPEERANQVDQQPCHEKEQARLREDWELWQPVGEAP